MIGALVVGALLVDFVLLGAAAVSASAGVVVAAAGWSQRSLPSRSCCGWCVHEDRSWSRPCVAALHVPAGYRASIYARGLVHPTAMSFGPDSRLYVSEDIGSVVSVARGTTRPKPFLRNLLVPLGLLWRGRTLYVSQSGRVDAFGVNGRRLRVVLSGLPYKLHQQDAIVAGPDGRLYLGSGSTCDACVERNPRSATILSFRPDGTGLRIVARGLRNPYGLLFVGSHAVRDRQRPRHARRRRAGRERS